MQITNHIIINRKYRLLEKIGNGSFGDIYKGQNIRTNEYVAIKMESSNANMRMIKHEAIIYQYLLNTCGVPKIKWFGKDDCQNYYMVIPLLGDSLQTHKDRGHLQDISRIGVQLIDLLRTLHEKGLIHRDVKPANFLFENSENTSQLFIIDFGLCRPYVEGGAHIAQKKTSALIGSQMYASINAHNCIELSRRDDIESVGYILLYFYLGELPWKNSDTASLVRIKREILTTPDMPSIFIDYFNHVRGLSFEDKPDYGYLIELFADF
jgi:serine/threonine protein kinase